MTINEKNANTREAVGVFADATGMQTAIDELLASGFEADALNLLASTDTVESKLGHIYRKVAELEDDPAVPRDHYVPAETVEGADRGAIGVLAMAGALSTGGAVVISGGSLAAVALAAALGAGTWGLMGEVLTKFVGADHAKDLEDQLSAGGLLLWVRCANAAQETRAQEILKKHSGKDVHVHTLPVAA